MGVCKGHFLRSALPGNWSRGPWGALGAKSRGPGARGARPGRLGWAALASPTRQDQGDQSLGYPATACF